MLHDTIKHVISVYILRFLCLFYVTNVDFTFTFTTYRSGQGTVRDLCSRVSLQILLCL